MSTQNQIEALIQGYQRKDPRLYDILRLLAGNVESLRELVNIALTPETIITEDPLLPLPAGIDYTLPGDSLKIGWSSLDVNGDPISPATSFELRKGTDWATASLVVRTSSFEVTLSPNLTTGTHTYLLKTINSSGSYSVNFLTLVVNISIVSAPGLTSQVIDNNILLYWTTPSVHSFNISHYELFREGSSLGYQYGTFLATFESAGGTFEYSIKAYDLAGNVSIETAIDILVSAPPDFELIATLLSTFSGTKRRCYVDGTQLLAPVLLTATWQDHFSSRGWTSIQDQINAGYPIYLQPTPQYP